MSPDQKASQLRDHHTQPISVVDNATGHHETSVVVQVETVQLERRRMARTENSRTQELSQMAVRSQDSVASVVHSEHAELAEVSAVHLMATVVVVHDETDKCRKAMTPPANPRVSAVVLLAMAIVLRDQDVADSDAVVVSVALLVELADPADLDLADQAHLAAVIIPTLKIKQAHL